MEKHFLHNIESFLCQISILREILLILCQIKELFDKKNDSKRNGEIAK